MVKKTRQSLPKPPAGLPPGELTQTANALHSAALRLLRRARAADDVAMDLDGPRASALSVLVFGGDQTLSGLAAIEQVSPPAMTKTVAALEDAGLATRTRSKTDRREVIIAATAKGRAVLERGRAARVRTIAGLMAGTSRADRRALAHAAEIIAGMLAR